jgi:electron transfer flavoprotein beta subunit
VESTDGYTGIVPQLLAGYLDVPNATFAKKLEVSDGRLHYNRQTEKGYDVIECPLPAVLTVTAGVNEPRYPSFKGIVGAKSKPVEELSLSDLQVQGTEATQSVAEVKDAERRGAGEIVQDDGTGAQRIADFLTQAKVI